MNKQHLLKVATVIALLIAIAWAIYEPTFEPVITSITLAIAVIGLFAQKQVKEKQAQPIENTITIDAKNYPGAKKSEVKLSYDSRIKLWELLEYASDCVIEAVPSNYGKLWVYKNAESGEVLNTLGSYAREKGFLEEEAKSLLHIGLGPATKLDIVKL